ncbi:MAG: FliM/FliN family flagellar motor switch protein [Myxococcota bacterium]
MSRIPEIAAFPWSALEAVDALAEAALWRARRWLEPSVAEPARLAASLGALLGVEVRLVRGAVRRNAPGRWLKLGFRAHGSATNCVVGVEPQLAAALLSLLLRRPLTVLSPDAELDSSAAGALSALFVEAARASSATLALRPCPAHLHEDAVALHMTALVAGKPYAAVVWLMPEPYGEPATDPRATLSALGNLEISLPLVIALGTTTARALVALTRGAAFCPGSETWIDVHGVGRGVLISPTSELGLAVELGSDARIVLREPTRVALASAEEHRMNSDEASGPPTLAQAVLDAPVVVRVELGSVSMAAREWAALRAGDVIHTGRRIAEPVLLRAGGRVVARGELVNIEGELGVRVLELGAETGA